MLVIPAFKKLNQEDHKKFKVSLDYMARFCFKSRKKKRRDQIAGGMY